MSECEIKTHRHDKYLEFKVGSSLFAYPIAKIKEIMEYPQVEPITGAPNYIKGAMNLRGELLPIFELSLCLGKETLQVGPKTCVVVTELEHHGERFYIGNKVDLVTQVIDINDDQLEPVPDLAGNLANPLLKGLAKLDSRLLTIIDVDQLLHSAQWDWLSQHQNGPKEKPNIEPLQSSEPSLPDTLGTGD
ncbi:chemotaxis protein CheW [Vibrio kyushuensis]|uniref:chemotaxis protein CheW n=1 Tax=Vibrio kyushuensis TaxID=2910249 RepID=UPI003D0DD32E